MYVYIYIYIYNILFSCTNTLNQRLDKLTLQVTGNNTNLKEICKESVMSLRIQSWLHYIFCIC